MRISKKNNHSDVVEKYERKFIVKDKRKQMKMKVSGSSVKKLSRIVSGK